VEYCFFGLWLVPQDFFSCGGGSGALDLNTMYFKLEDYNKFHRTYRNTIFNPDFGAI
jgi:hypothetical protein